jgi:hypothetical protein
MAVSPRCAYTWVAATSNGRFSPLCEFLRGFLVRVSMSQLLVLAALAVMGLTIVASAMPG